MTCAAMHEMEKRIIIYLKHNIFDSIAVNGIMVVERGRRTIMEKECGKRFPYLVSHPLWALAVCCPRRAINQDDAGTPQAVPRPHWPQSALYQPTLAWETRCTGAQGQDAADKGTSCVVPAQDHHSGANGSRREERGKRKLPSGPQRLSTRAAAASLNTCSGCSDRQFFGHLSGSLCTGPFGDRDTSAVPGCVTAGSGLMCLSSPDPCTSHARCSNELGRAGFFLGVLIPLLRHCSVCAMGLRQNTKTRHFVVYWRNCRVIDLLFIY
ncbi:hypothetical protein NDU88_005988 [Pleurodeles waltl]|uniref:Uncharacterized protein n=1 Tax=Pleurodeles waltl TaxID=8319 RepID=A0AAV7X158_PLEWA|nr:hypothetical protein NDU88_005988 [Pleurodeles waltl]